MPLVNLLAAALLAAPPPRDPTLSTTCANDPGLFHARPLPRGEIDAMLRFYDNSDVRIAYVGASSFEMSGPCARTFRFVASGLVLDNGRTLGLSEPPLALTRSDYVSPAHFIPAPINAELRAIDGANVGTTHRLRYVTSLGIADNRRIGLWSNAEVSAVETVSCTADDRCADPVPLVSSRHRIREIFLMPGPDISAAEVLHLWVEGGHEREESIRIVLVDMHSPLLGWNGRRPPAPACELHLPGPCS